MPVNRNALIRYRTIDNCLKNRFKKWTLDDLVNACSDALYEYQGIDKGISKRTVQADIEMMRSNKLGYEAPITVTDKKYYTYSDKDFSITNIPIGQQDMQILSEAASMLQQFKGFSHFADLSEMVSKLEDKIYTSKTHCPPVIEFEKNDSLKGLEFLEPIRKAIVSKTAVCISYQSFKARQANEFCFSPVLLKEYRNRWFAVGTAHQRKSPFLNLALDRIQSLKEDTAEFYRASKDFDLHTYYNNVIGVTKSPGQQDCEVIFWIDSGNAPYVITKPLHHSQKLLKIEEDGKIFSIRVILNFELERELLGFGDRLKVIAPRFLVKRMRETLEKSLSRYTLTDIPSQP